MTRKLVKFTRADAPKPLVLPQLGTVALRAPIAFLLRKGGTQAIDLGLSCSSPLLLLPSTKFEISGAPIIGAGLPVKVTVVGKVDEVIGEGEAFLNAVPLGLAEFDVE